VPAYRLLSVQRAETVERHLDRPLVGRAPELAVLVDELSSAVRDRSCRLVTLIAEAGTGKSRLIEEFARMASPGARVVKGRCLPYGRGITFWPLVEIVREAAAIRDEDSPDTALAKLTAVAGADDVAVRVASAVGFGAADFGLDEINWGTRRLFELQASEKPLVVVFEDIHWAESALLDLIEYVLATASDVPLLIVCAARPDFLEYRQGWLDRESSVVRIEPLSDEESGLVVQQLLGDAPIPAAARARIVEAAEGNPLFVEQLLSMLIDDGLLRYEDDEWVAGGDLAELAIPSTIQGLLAARLDLLSREERAVIEPASVIGLVFHRGAVEHLVPEPVRPEVEAHLGSMSRKQLVRSQPTTNDTDYRFQHILIRDAAYQGLLKRARATFHERFADWAEEVNRERDRGTEFDEILGYHLEQANQYLTELGPLDEHGLELGRRAATKLAAAGRRAFARGDMAAAANLLRRAAGVLPEGDVARLELLPDLGEALTETGEFAWAQVFLDEAVEGATALEDERLRADAVLTRLFVRHHAETDLGSFLAELERTTDELIPMLEERGAHAELATAWRLIALPRLAVCHWEAAATALRQAVEHARLAGDRRLEARLSGGYSQTLVDSPMPVPAAIAACEELLQRDLGHKQSEAMIRNSIACLVALDGDFDRARRLYREARAMLEDLGASVLAASTSFMLGRIELLSGNPEAAELDLRADHDRLKAIGEVYFRTSIGAMLAHAVYAQDRIDEAELIALEAQELAAGDDIEVDALCLAVRGKVLARRGQLDEALRLAEEAVAAIPGGEAPLMRTEALIELADVSMTAGDLGRARAALEEARDLAAIKDMAVLQARVDALLDGLGHEAAQPVA
jgi:tetratricopeptide (TPR) repeat protein